MAQGPLSVTGAAKEVGVHRATVHRLASKDAEFAAELGEARESSLDLIEAKLVEAATKGIPEETVTVRVYPDGTKETITKRGNRFVPTAGFFMLKRWRPEYRDSYRAELSGPDGGPVRIESIDVIDRPFAELVVELARRGRTVEPQDLVGSPDAARRNHDEPG
jgi:hypothetical protein